MYNMIMLKNKFISFLLFAIVTYSASFIGSIATISYKEPWYSSLNKSFLTPPVELETIYLNLSTMVLCKKLSLYYR